MSDTPPGGCAYVAPWNGERRAWQKTGGIYEELAIPDGFGLAPPRVRVSAAREWSPHHIWRDAGYVRIREGGIPSAWREGYRRVIAVEQSADIAALSPHAASADELEMPVKLADACSTLLDASPAPVHFNVKASSVAAFEKIASRACAVTFDVTEMGLTPLDVFAGATQLRRLDLRYANGLSAKAFDVMRGFEQLAALAIKGSMGLGLAALKCEETLRSFIRLGMRDDDDKAGIHELARFRGLQELRLGVHAPARDQLAPLGELRELREAWITIRGAGPLPDLRWLSQLPELKKLRIDTVGVTRAEDIEVLAELPNLESFNLSSQVGDDIAAVLCRCRALRQLGISSSSGDAKRSMTDAGVEELARIEQLASLHLSTRVGDRSLAAISRLSGLASLRIEGSFTASGIEKLGSLSKLRILSLGRIDEDAARGIAKLHAGGWPLARVAMNSIAKGAKTALKRELGKNLVDYGHAWTWHTDRAFSEAELS